MKQSVYTTGCGEGLGTVGTVHAYVHGGCTHTKTCRTTYVRTYEGMSNTYTYAPGLDM